MPENMNEFASKVLAYLPSDKDEEIQIFDRILRNPNGIVLVTGPTGSGKSTTLYAALNELNNDAVNIVTVEDPVKLCELITELMV